MSTQRQQIGRAGGLESWARTVDRTARTANGRKAAPSDLEWHVARLDPEKFKDATEAQKLKAAEAAKKAYYARLSMRSAQSRAQRKSTETEKR